MGFEKDEIAKASGRCVYALQTDDDPEDFHYFDSEDIPGSDYYKIDS